MQKTRIQLSVEPELGALLKNLAHETNSSTAGLISELLMEMAPILEKNLTLIRMAKTLQEKGKDTVKAHLEKTLEVMEKEISQATEALDKKLQ